MTTIEESGSFSRKTSMNSDDSVDGEESIEIDSNMSFTEQIMKRDKERGHVDLYQAVKNWEKSERKFSEGSQDSEKMDVSDFQSNFSKKKFEVKEVIERGTDESQEILGEVVGGKEGETKVLDDGSHQEPEKPVDQGSSDNKGNEIIESEKKEGHDQILESKQVKNENVEKKDEITEKDSNIMPTDKKPENLQTKVNTKSRKNTQLSNLATKNTESALVQKVSLAKYELNLKLVTKSEEILSLNPKIILEKSKSRHCPSIGKITPLRTPCPSPIKKFFLRILIFLAPLVTQFMNTLTLQNDIFSSTQNSFQNLAESIGFLKAKYRYQGVYKNKDGSRSELHVSFFSLIKFFLFVNMVLIIINLQLDFTNDYNFRILCLMFISVVVFEHLTLYLRIFMRDWLDRRPNYLLIRRQIPEQTSLTKVLDLEAPSDKKKPFSRKSNKNPVFAKPANEPEVGLANFPEVASSVKKEFVFKNIDSNFKCLNRGPGEAKVMTGYRNDRLMSRSPETHNFIYSDGQNFNSLETSSLSESNSSLRQKVIQNLQKYSKETSDVIYFVFLCRSNQAIGGARFRVLELGSTAFKINKILKIKIKPNTLKIQYFGDIDSEIISLLQKFQMDYEHFINGKFLTKCVQKAYSNSKENQILPEIFNEIQAPSVQTEQSKTEQPTFSAKKRPKRSDPKNSEPKTKETPPAETLKTSQSEIEKPNEIPLSKSQQLKADCARLVKQINEPDMNFNIADLYESERELFIAKRFLETYQKYKVYEAEEDKWKVSDKHKEYTAWARDDGRFIVRKAEITTDINLPLLEKTMKNFAEGNKWNPMLGKFASLIFRQDYKVGADQRRNDAQPNDHQNAHVFQ